MKDAEYVFRKDIQDKKSIGRGAFHKKTGSKSKKCTLPSDYLSGKEKKALNTNNGLKVEASLTTKFLEELNKSVNSTPATSISYFTIHMDQFDDNIWNQIKSLFAGHDGLMI